MNLIQTQINAVRTAKDIYKTEPLTYLEIKISEGNNINYLVVKSMSVDSEYLDTWFCKTITDKETAIKLIHRVQFKNEHVEYTDKGLEVYIKNSPRLNRIRKAVHDLRHGNFYDELHKEDIGYTIITNNIKGLKKFQQKYRDIVKIYPDDDCKGLYDVFIG